jgi:hypothetical protein
MEHGETNARQQSDIPRQAMYQVQNEIRGRRRLHQEDRLRRQSKCPTGGQNYQIGRLVAYHAGVKMEISTYSKFVGELQSKVKNDL